MSYKIDPVEYKSLLRSLKSLPKEANQELRKEARQIADQIVLPAVIQAIDSHVAQPYAQTLIRDTRSRGDRVPTVVVGKKKKVLSGGASSNFIRFGTVKGVYQSRSGRLVTWADGRVTPGWTKAASDNYLEPAFQAWEQTVQAIMLKWNRGK